MAWRCAVLNPHLAADAARQTSGVVLIDEVDLHLHPRWQARVLDDLLRAFPLLQFVTTTHSPQVIATCRPEWIRVLEQGRERPKSVAFVHGWDSNSVLRGVMDADARPRFAQERLEAVTLALTAKRWEDAEKLIVQLAQDLGPADPEIVRAWLDLRFEKDMDDA
jgi:predicted ATP-binding protein involved in virulence